MILSPRLTICGFVFANHQDRNVRLVGSLDRSLDAFLLRRRINELHIVGEPAVPVILGIGDLAAFGVDDIGLRAHSISDTLHDADPVHRIAAVPTKVNSLGIRPDHGNVLELREIKRKKGLTVLQKYDRCLGSLQRESTMLSAVGRLLCVVRINKYTVEKPKAKFGLKHV